MAGKKRFVYVEDVKGEAHNGGLVKPLITPDIIGSKGFRMVVAIYEPGKGRENHRHPSVEEAMFIIRGGGVMPVEGEDIPIKPGMALYIPPGAKHGYKNTGKEQMMMVAVISPPRESYEKA